MKIILAGHAGIGKREVIKNIKDSLAPGITFQHFPAEEGLILKTAMKSPRDLMDAWYKRFQANVVEPWKALHDEKPAAAIISMHLSWQVESHILSPLVSPHAIDILNFFRDDFRPSHVVTLIDNIYRSQKVIAHEGYNIRLGELLRWRNIETILADMLANLVATNDYTHDKAIYPFEHSPALAVNHPADIVPRYIQRNVPRIYLSYPISAPRRIYKKTRSKEPIHEINRFRNYFSRKFVAFDPVTIDERPLNVIRENSDKELRDATLAQFEKILTRKQSDAKKLKLLTARLDASRADRRVSLRTADVWERDAAEYARSMRGLGPADIDGLSIEQISGITVGANKQHSEVDRQIRMRDYRLIDQADCVVTYRPTYKDDAGKVDQDWSGGTAAELHYAYVQAKKPVFVITDPVADGNLNEGPFGADLGSGLIKS
jgi:hypothetical protein